jgi:hypothetical protein
MKRALVVVLLAAAIAVAVPATAFASTTSPTTLSPTDARQELVTMLSSVACPVLASQAAPAFQPLVESQCEAIFFASPDPVAAAEQFLPLLCAGNPPLGATVFPQYAPLFDAACPIVSALPPLPTLPLGGVLSLL